MAYLGMMTRIYSPSIHDHSNWGGAWEKHMSPTVFFLFPLCFNIICQCPHSRSCSYIPGLFLYILLGSDQPSQNYLVACCIYMSTLVSV